MKKLKIGYLIIVFLSVWLLGYLFLSPVMCSANEQPQTITISIEQFQSLKLIINEQEQSLTEFEQKLSLLEMTTPELLNTLNEQKALLIKTQKRLQSAELSLNEASEIIDVQNKSLQTLSEQIKKEQDINKRKRLQQTFWGIVGGVLIGAAVK